ncbi:MAG TPA: hypothetical protein VGR03_00120 [Candidatus Acidoferrum sp.]|nr:hypothetical protein [Candidatus Acidoferrum sp.]
MAKEGPLIVICMTRVIPKIELADTSTQELLPYTVVYTVYAPIENRKVAFNRICAD